MMSQEEVRKFFDEQRKENAENLNKAVKAIEKSVDARMYGFSKRLDSITEDNAKSKEHK